MAETDGGIGAHHVEVAPPAVVPEIDALAAHDGDGKRRIFFRAETGLEFAHDTHPPVRPRQECRPLNIGTAQADREQK